MLGFAHRDSVATRRRLRGELLRLFKKESIRKSSNFNFSGQKPCTRLIYKNIAFFFTFFKGYKYNYFNTCNNTKDHFSSEPEKINVKLHKNCENTGKFLKNSYVRCHFVKFNIYFLGPSREIFFGVITDN